MSTPKSTIPSPWTATRRGDCIAIESADQKPLALLVWHEHSEAKELWEAAQLMACAQEMRDALATISTMASFPSSGSSDNSGNRVNLLCVIGITQGVLARVKGGGK